MHRVLSKNQLYLNVIRSIIGGNLKWYSNTDFAYLLKKELSKSDETGLPIFYIVFDLSQYSDIVAESDYIRFLEEFIILLSQNTRAYDIGHIPCVSKIGLLLIKTSLNGAKRCIERISKELHDHLKSRKMREASEIIRSITISSYLLSQTFENDKNEANHALIGDSKLANRMRRYGDRRMTFDEIFNKAINWNIKLLPDVTTLQATPIPLEDFYDRWLTSAYAYIKRFFDILGALFWLILSTPMMLITAIAIKTTSKGPVFFKQKRLGYLGKPFNLLKFRTMHKGCDNSIHEEYVKKLIKGKNGEINRGTQEAPLYKLTGDSRITSVGKFLRKTSIDEIPQLINVLRGEMSLVGPRPPIPYEVEEYKDWHYRRILEVKPGITGLWQVSGRNETTFDEMVRLDIQYAENWSFLLDLKILLKTIKAVFNGS